MNVEVVTIGDELLLGQTIDTNAAWLARELSSLGIAIARRATVGDAAGDIAGAVRDALDRTGAVITTGGLGPTADDRSKPAVAALFGRELRFHEDLWEDIRRLWRARARPGEPPEANKQQVMIPEGATVLHNRHGSAPGILLEDDNGRWVAMLPGVPREMRGLLADELVPWLRRRVGPDARVIRSLTLRTTGVPESQLPERLGNLADGVGIVSLAYLPAEHGVDLRLTVRGEPAEDADRLLASAATQLRERLGPAVYAEGSTDLAAVVLAHCRSRGLRIAVAESCTGGLLGARLTSISGSSDVVAGGVIAYANAVKTEALGVEAAVLAREGAVSRAVAVAMAAGVRARFGTEVGIGITGVAGPQGGTPEKPVGLVWIAVLAGETEKVLEGRFSGDRAEIRYRATQAAMDMLRRALIGPAG